MSIPDQLRQAVEQLKIAVRKDSQPEIDRAIDAIGRILPIQREKVSSLRSDADILFSPRKHLKYGGRDEVKQNILRTCASLDVIANQIDPSRRVSRDESDAGAEADS
jgi:hypothetical protein